ncbi:MAG: hypothetical protein ACM3NZ_04210, partial [Betaproteobacteria bacterium]
AVRNGALEVAVVDTGRGVIDKIGSGVGLANIRARLSALFGAHARLVLAPNLPQGLRAAIVTPFAGAGAPSPPAATPARTREFA